MIIETHQAQVIANEVAAERGAADKIIKTTQVLSYITDAVLLG